MASEPTRPSDTAELQDRRWQEFVEQLRHGPPRPFEEQWARYREIYADRPDRDGPPRTWRPTEHRRACSNLGRLIAELKLGGYEELHAWSVQDRPAFWSKVIELLGVVFTRRPDTTLDLSGGAESAAWLPGAELNCVDSCFTANPAKPAIISGAEGSERLRMTTYGELERLVDRVAAGLRRCGFEPGERIALYQPMTVECVAAYLGVIRAGCAVVSIADSFSAAELARRIEIGGASGVVTVDHYRRAGKRIELYDKVREAATPRAIVIVSDGPSPPELREGDLTWAELVEPAAPPERVTSRADALINVLFSSGTTDTPKAIAWDHLTPVKCAMDGRFHQDVQASDITAWPTNIGWMMGPWLIFATLFNDATMALYEGAPTGKGFARFVQEARVTMLGLVPSLVRAWRSAGALDHVDWSHVRVFSSTGEPSSREDYLWLMSRTGYRAPVIEYCGGTEIGGGYITGTVVQPASPATFTTPALGLKLVLLDPEGRPSDAGEVFLVPPSIGLSARLLNRDHHEVYYAGVPAGPDGRVLRRHGDRIARLPGGFFRALGRADDTMNLGGIKVGSNELEQAIDAHPAVRESAAIAVQAGGEGAEQLVVYVVTEQEIEARELTRELDRLIASRLNPLFRIHEIVLVDELPRTASNKLMRRELRQRYGERE